MLKQVQHDKILFVTLNCLGFCFTKSRYSLHFVIVRLTFCSFTSALSFRTTRNPLIKEPCWVYVDDRSITFDGDFDILRDKIDNFKPYYK